MAGPVTDPSVLARFQASQSPDGQVLALYDPQGNAPVKQFGAEAMVDPLPAPKQPKPVSDPAVLERFEASRKQPASATVSTLKNALKDGRPGAMDLAEVLMSETAEALNSTDVFRGAREGATNRGIGVVQTGYDVMKTLGLIDEDPEFEAAVIRAHDKATRAAKGSGVGGFVGEMVGDPANMIGGGAVGGAAIKGLRKSAAIKALAKQGAKAGAITGAVSGATGVREEGETRLGNIARDTAIGGAIGGGLPAGARTVGAGARGSVAAADDIIASGRFKSDDEIKETAGKMFDEGRRLLDNSYAQGVRVGSPQGIAAAARAKLVGRDALSKERHPTTIRILNELDEQVANGTLTYAQLVARMKDLTTATGEDGLVAGKAKGAIMEALAQPGGLSGQPNNVAEALTNLTQSDAQFSKAFRYRDWGEEIGKANMVPNQLKTRLSNFARDNTNNLQPAELEALEIAKKNGALETILRYPGGLGVDAGSISRNPRVLVPFLMSGGLRSAGGYAAGVGSGAGALPVVAVGTVANTVRGALARGKAAKFLESIEKRPLPPAVTPAPPAPPVAPPTPQLPGPAAQLALPAPPTIMVPGGPGGALRPADATERAGMYAQRGRTPEFEVPGAGTPRAPSTVQQEANNSVRSQYQNMGLTGDVLKAQRGRQVSAAEAQKAIQDAAAVPELSLGQMLTETQVAARNRGQDLSPMGEALAKAIWGQ